MSSAQRDPSRAQVLVVEDSSVFREMQGLLLRQAGFGVWLFEHPRAALAEAAGQKFDLVVIDYELPEMNGEEFMHALRSIQPSIPVIFVSGSLTLELAIKLGQQGVAGIFNKPANPKILLEKINETLSRAARDTSVRVGSKSPHATGRAAVVAPAPEPHPGQLAYEPQYLFGTSDTFREFTHRLWRVRDFRSTLLFQGDPGSPFELLAHELANLSMFRDGPVMPCEREEFEPRRLIEVLAPSLLSQDAGTLIVSGVDDFTAEQQQTLENLLTGRDVFLPFARRFRLILATTGRLTERVDAGTFDETLFYKISSLPLSIPSLDAMRADVPVNALHLVRHHHATVNSTAPADLSPDAPAWLEAQDWPGNYAQLARLVLLAIRHATGPLLDVPALEAAWYECAGQARVPETSSTSQVMDPAAAAGRDAVPIAADFTAAAEVSGLPPATVRETLPPETSLLPAPKLLPAASAAPARMPAAATRSLFRPSATRYNFGKRLGESIATAQACVSAA